MWGGPPSQVASRGFLVCCACEDVIEDFGRRAHEKFPPQPARPGDAIGLLGLFCKPQTLNPFWSRALGLCDSNSLTSGSVGVSGPESARLHK